MISKLTGDHFKEGSGRLMNVVDVDVVDVDVDTVHCGRAVVKEWKQGGDVNGHSTSAGLSAGRHHARVHTLYTKGQE
eukprot:561643-Amphidinium_carterae.1